MTFSKSIMTASAAAVVLSGCGGDDDPPNFTDCKSLSSEQACDNEQTCQWVEPGDAVCSNQDTLNDYFATNTTTCEQLGNDAYLGYACEDGCGSNTLTPVTWADVLASSWKPNQGKNRVSFLLPAGDGGDEPNNQNGFMRCDGRAVFDDCNGSCLGTVQFTNIKNGNQNCERLMYGADDGKVGSNDPNRVKTTAKLTQQQFEDFLPLLYNTVKSCEADACGISTPPEDQEPTCISAEKYCDRSTEEQGATAEVCDTTERKWKVSGKTYKSPLCEINDGECSPAVPTCSYATAPNKGGNKGPGQCKVQFDGEKFRTPYCQPTKTGENFWVPQCSDAPFLECVLNATDTGCNALDIATNTTYTPSEIGDFVQVCGFGQATQAECVQAANSTNTA